MRVIGVSGVQRCALPISAWSWATVGVVPTVHWPGVAEQATLVLDRPLAAASVRVAPVTLAGPLLVTRIVYVVLPPALTEVTPSVLVTARSACRWAKKLLAVLTVVSVSTIP